MEEFNQLTQILMDRLEKKGMDPSVIPGFMRSLASTVLVNSTTNLVQVNDTLHLLGWDEIDLDYRTYELATVCLEFESDEMIVTEEKPMH